MTREQELAEVVRNGILTSSENFASWQTWKLSGRPLTEKLSNRLHSRQLKN